MVDCSPRTGAAFGAKETCTSFRKIVKRHHCLVKGIRCAHAIFRLLSPCPPFHMERGNASLRFQLPRGRSRDRRQAVETKRAGKPLADFPAPFRLRASRAGCARGQHCNVEAPPPPLKGRAGEGRLKIAFAQRIPYFGCTAMLAPQAPSENKGQKSDIRGRKSDLYLLPSSTSLLRHLLCSLAFSLLICYTFSNR